MPSGLRDDSERFLLSGTKDTKRLVNYLNYVKYYSTCLTDREPFLAEWTLKWTEIRLKCITYSFWVYNFAITPQQYMFFALKVLYVAIDIAVHFNGVFKFFEHEHNCQLSYPDHLEHQLAFYWQTFATCLVDYMKWIAVLDTLCEKSMLICVTSDFYQVVF